MRYVALTRLNFTAPVHVVGVGETQEQARTGAINWFGQAIDRGWVRGTPELIALQDRLTIMTEDDLLAQSGVGLDEWLARGAGRGETPGSTVAAAAAPIEPVFAARRENRLVGVLQDMGLVLVMLVALPLGLTFWQLSRLDYFEGMPAAAWFWAFVILAVVGLVVNVLRFFLFKLALGFSLREYLAVVLVMQVIVRVLWETTGGSIWLGILSLLFV